MRQCDTAIIGGGIIGLATAMALADDPANVSDLLALLSQFDSDSPTICTGGSCDFNCDGCVDITDLLKLLAHYTPDLQGIGCP